MSQYRHVRALSAFLYLVLFMLPAPGNLPAAENLPALSELMEQTGETVLASDAPAPDGKKTGQLPTATEAFPQPDTEELALRKSATAETRLPAKISGEVQLNKAAMAKNSPSKGPGSRPKQGTPSKVDRASSGRNKPGSKDDAAPSRPRPVPIRAVDEEEEAEEVPVSSPIWQDRRLQLGLAGFLLIVVVMLRRRRKASAGSGTIIPDEDAPPVTGEEAGQVQTESIEDAAGDTAGETSGEMQTVTTPPPAKKKSWFGWGKGTKKKTNARNQIVSEESPVVAAASGEASEISGNATARIRAARGLVEALALPDAVIAKHATLALIRLGADAVPVLVEALARPEGKLRLFAAGALARIGAPALTPLLACVKHADAGVRLHACLALGMLGEQDALPALVSLSKDKDPEVARRAAEAVERVKRSGK